MNNDQVLDLLYTRFPRTFVRNPAERQPLKRGIDRDLVARLDDIVSRNAFKRVLGVYTSCSEYRAKLIEGAARIDLDGNAAGAVTASEAEHALELEPVKIKPTSSTPPAPPPKPKRASLEDLRLAGQQRKGLA